MTHTELSLRERRVIEDMLNAKIPVCKIASEIGRHRATVYREIRRNRNVDDELPKLNGYYGMNAQRSATNRRRRCCKLVRFVDLRLHVIKQLAQGWSPEQIAGRLRYDGQSLCVSHETILNRLGFTGGQNSRRIARYGTDTKEEDLEAVFI